MGNENIDRLKPIAFIEVKYKKGFLNFIAMTFDHGNSYLHFKGVEVEDLNVVLNYDRAVELCMSKDAVEKYFPWESVVQVTLKRLPKKE